MPTELAVSKPQELAAPQSPVAWAIANNVSPEHMLQYFELQERIDAKHALQAFNEAFTAFKNESIRIVRDKENTQYSKGAHKAMYTSLENMIATVTPFLSKHGLAASWGVPAQTPTSITVSCTLTHVMGHSRTESLTGPMDESGAKNKLQQVKSSMTYLKVATYESVCGLASAFGSLSDDGNAAGADPHMPEEEFLSYKDAIDNSHDESELKRFFAAAYTEAKKLKDKTAEAAFTAAKESAKKRLGL